MNVNHFRRYLASCKRATTMHCSLLAFVFFAAAPTVAQTTAHIDMTALSAWDEAPKWELDIIDNSDTPGQSQWSYTSGREWGALTLFSAGGDYVLTGMHTNATVTSEKSAENANITLNNFNISYDGSSTFFARGAYGTISLSGSNAVKSNRNAGIVVTSSSNTLTITSSSHGGLTVESGGSSAISFSLSSAAVLDIAGNSQVTAKSTRNSSTSSFGVSTNQGTINVATGATLNAASLYNNAISTLRLTLNVNGKVNAVGGNIGINNNGVSLIIKGNGSVYSEGGTHGIHSEYDFEIEGCDVTAVGISGWAIGQKYPDTDSILMNDAARLTMTNGATSVETHIFEASNTTSTYMWKLTGAATTTDPLTNASITVSIPAGGTGTVERVSSSGSGALTFTNNAAYNIPAAIVGTAIENINIALGVSGGTPPYTFSATGLPPGISIDGTTGIISGTPTATSAAGTATVTVTDNASQTRSITINFGTVSSSGSESDDDLFNVTGFWYDPARSGSGFNFAQIRGETHLYYYGYTANGQRLWLISDGGKVLKKGQTQTYSMLEIKDGNFNQPSTNLQRWGTLDLTLNGCGEGYGVLTGIDGTQTHHLKLLGSVDNTQCAGGSSNNGGSFNITGFWYDPALSGSGFNFAQIRGETHLYYYGYTANGQRLWLISDGGKVLKKGQTQTYSMLEIKDGTFDDPSQNLRRWGTLDLTSTNCGEGNAVLSGTDGTKRFGLKLLGKVDDTVCW